MVLCASAAAAMAAGYSHEAKFVSDWADIRVVIRSNDYVYEVTNWLRSPVVGFEVPQHAAYNFATPPGWRKDTSGEAFEAWTEVPADGIQPGQTKNFSFRVSSEGADLGRGAVKLRFLTGQTVEVPNVLAAVPEPRGYVATIAGLMLGIVLFHSALLIRRGRRRREEQVTVL